MEAVRRYNDLMIGFMFAIESWYVDVCVYGEIMYKVVSASSWEHITQCT